MNTQQLILRGALGMCPSEDARRRREGRRRAGFEAWVVAAAARDGNLDDPHGVRARAGRGSPAFAAR